MEAPFSELPLAPGPGGAVKMRLIGVGGGGANAVDRLRGGMGDRLQLAVVNTDSRALQASPVAEKLLIGSGLTRGLSAGGDPDVGLKAAEADEEKLTELVKGMDLVFLATGLGGGTGSGATPVVADLARDEGALVVAFVTMPFSFEGGRRLAQAEEALKEMRRSCHAVVVLPNDVLLQQGGEGVSVIDAFAQADAWMARGIGAVCAMLSGTGVINLDFSSLRQTFGVRGGKTLFGFGVGEGADAATRAVESLRECPLLHIPEATRQADRLLVGITGGPDLSLQTVQVVMEQVTGMFGREAHVVMGTVVDETRAGQIEICVLGVAEVTTGFANRSSAARKPVREPAPTAPAATNARPAKAGSSDAKPAAKGTQQEEFGFEGAPGEERGSFVKSERNLFEGQDLDVPTFLRKGIKVSP